MPHWAFEAACTHRIRIEREGKEDGGKGRGEVGGGGRGKRKRRGRGEGAGRMERINAEARGYVTRTRVSKQAKGVLRQGTGVRAPH